MLDSICTILALRRATVDNRWIRINKSGVWTIYCWYIIITKTQLLIKTEYEDFPFPITYINKKNTGSISDRGNYYFYEYQVIYKNNFSDGYPVTINARTPTLDVVVLYVTVL